MIEKNGLLNHSLWQNSNSFVLGQNLFSWFCYLFQAAEETTVNPNTTIENENDIKENIYNKFHESNFF